MSKSKWLEKLGLVESNGEIGGDLQYNSLSNLPNYNFNTEDVEINIDVENLTKPDEIYSENEIADKSRSIFKVDEIKSVLPATIPNQAKKDSVLGMMKVSNLTLDEVLEDANKRTEILNGALQRFTDETINIVESSENEIKQLEEKINNLKEKITNRKKNQEDQEEIINNELQKIKDIVDFIKQEDK